MPSVMGKRFECSDHGAQYMVTKAGAGDLSCTDAGQDGPNQLGKRYQCATCEATLLCTKAGTGIVCCDGAPMALLAAKTLPSSD
ncbi:MAG: desulfoferrodoxin [Chloroflexi bacterium]|nr:desulfoferrodoxin [Chloroflexota bacterium]MDA1172987.1 desulfoferrodoxin [Chloroflexota bacterium]